MILFSTVQNTMPNTTMYVLGFISGCVFSTGFLLMFSTYRRSRLRKRSRGLSVKAQNAIAAEVAKQIARGLRSGGQLGK